MALYSYGFEDGVAGVPYEIDATPVGGLVYPFDDLSSHGDWSLRINYAGSYQFIQKNFDAPVTSAAVRVYFYQDEAATSNAELLRFHAATDTVANSDRVLTLVLQGANRLRVQVGSDTSIWTSNQGFTPGVWYRIEAYVQCGVDGDATVEVAYYIGESTTAERSFSIATATTPASIACVRLGKSTAGATTPDTGRFWLDSWAVDSAPAGLIGPYASPVNTAPTASAGVDQVGIAPYELVTLDGSGSSDPEGDPLTYQWTQLSGEAVELDDDTFVKPQFAAPATSNGDELVFRLVVNDGQEDSAADTVSVSVLPHDMWHIDDPVGPVLSPINTKRAIVVEPANPEDPDAPSSWQDAVDMAVLNQDWTPVVGWYENNTGHEALGYEVEDLIDVGTIASTADGQVLEGLTGTRLRIAHSNVTVRGCRITGGATYGAYYNPTFNSNYTNNVVEYCTFDDPNGSDTNAILFLSGEGSPTVNMTLRYNNCTGFSQGIRTRGNVVSEYNWMHDFSHPPGSHSNSYRHVGNTNCFAYRNYGTDGSSGTMSIYFDKEPTANIEYRENIMSGQSTPEGSGGPSYLINMKNGDYQAAATGIKIIDNMWGPGYQYGIISGGGGVAWGVNGNERTGNRDFMTGALIGNV